MINDSGSESDDSNKVVKLPEVQNTPRGFVSGWDDDAEGIEEEPNPHETPTKELLWAAENGEFDTVKKIIEENSSIINCKDSDGYTPLHRACYNNHFEIVEYLLRNGADLGAKTVDSWQPLHSACKWNSARCAAKLLSFGADVNAVTSGGLTALHLAASNSYAKETIELLLMHHDIKPDLKNDADEAAIDIARRSGRLAGLFEIVEPCFNM